MPRTPIGGPSLLKNLEGRPRPWTARFRAAVAIATPRDGVQCAEGACAGQIIPEERGTGGFGYDRIFLVEETGRTMAELPMAEKNRLSHRGRAITNARRILAEFVRGLRCGFCAARRAARAKLARSLP